MTIPVQITVDTKAVEKYLKDTPPLIERAMGRIIKKVAFSIEREAKIEAPTQTGDMKNKIATDLYPLTATVSTHSPYAIYVHEGTAAHIIDSPVNIRGVGWRYIGLHPGNKANPFMRRAAEKVERQIPSIIEDEMRALK